MADDARGRVRVIHPQQRGEDLNPLHACPENEHHVRADRADTEYPGNGIDAKEEDGPRGVPRDNCTLSIFDRDDDHARRWHGQLLFSL